MKGKALGKAAWEEAVDNGWVAVDRHILPGDEHVVEYDTQIRLVEAAGERIVEGGADFFRQVFVRVATHEGEAWGIEGHEEANGEVLFALNQSGRLDILTHIGDVAEGGPGGDHARPTHNNAIITLFHDVHVYIALLGRRL